MYLSGIALVELFPLHPGKRKKYKIIIENLPVYLPINPLMNYQLMKLLEVE
jgi:hypothetical protein